MAITDLRQELESRFPEPLLRSWPDVGKLLEVTSKFNGRPWLFRGAKSDQFTLTPKVGRDERKVKSAGRMPYSPADEKAALHFFKLRARALVLMLPESELEWLALAQHHGAPTRLLDWTEGLLVALWFAGEDCADAEPVIGTDHFKSITRDGCLWCVWDVPSVTKADAADPYNPVGVGAYRPAHFDGRISAQQSVFTLQPTPTTELQVANLFKFRVAHKFKFEMRKRLDASGVNKRALFPDLSGLGDDVAWRYKNNWLGAYREDGCSLPETADNDRQPVHQGVE